MKKYLSMVLAAVLALGAALVSAQPVEFVPPQQRPSPKAERPWPKNHFLTLCYPEVEDDAADERYLSVRTSALNEQIAWLRNNGYNPVSVRQILEAHKGGKELPEKAVLLSFDDGFSSFTSRVYPLLKAYDWPALWAPVGKWVDTPADEPVDFGGLPTELVPHFFQSFCESLGAALHVEVKGENTHHMVEACFKAVGRTLRQALRRDGDAMPSTKGMLS